MRVDEAGRVGITGMTDRPLVPLPGVAWWSCRFAVGEATRLDWAKAEEAASVDLPADLVRAVPRRRSEFLAGRLCAVLALRALGTAGAVDRAGRAPVWPAGIRGSISHCGNRAMAVATRDYAAIGLDCEAVLSPREAAEVAPLVVTGADSAHRPASWTAALYCSVIFSAKEAAYKAISHRLDSIPDFTEAVLRQVKPPDLALDLRGHPVAIRVALEGNDVVSLAWA